MQSLGNGTGKHRSVRRTAAILAPCFKSSSNIRNKKMVVVAHNEMWFTPVAECDND